jgi:hypothetical protein
MEPEITGPRNPEEEPPPFLHSWRNVYVAVFCYLLILITGLYALAREFHY